MSEEVFTFCPRCAAPMGELEIADDGGAQLRRACSNASATPCGYIQWRNPVPAIAAIVEHNGEIILARNAAWPEGMFALITGFLERNEEPTAGVKREVKEELNLDVQEITLVANYIYDRKNEVMLCYHVVATGEIKLSPELIDYKRVKPEKLRPWPRSTGFALADWMRSKGLEVKFLERP